MIHPQYLFYAAILAMALVELLRVRSFGPVIWVIQAVFAVSFAACNLGFQVAPIQMVLHGAAFVASLLIANRITDQFAGSLFLPMCTIDIMCVKGWASPYDWWWAIYYLAFAQLAVLAVSADLHPLGCWIRAWAERTWLSMEKRMVGFA